MFGQEDPRLRKGVVGEVRGAEGSGGWMRVVVCGVRGGRGADGDARFEVRSSVCMCSEFATTCSRFIFFSSLNRVREAEGRETPRVRVVA